MLLLLVMALAALEFLCVSLFDGSPFGSRKRPEHNNTVRITRQPMKKSQENVTLVSNVDAIVKDKTVASSTKATNATNPAMKYCEVPLNLGPISVNKAEINLSSVEEKFPEVTSGGCYKPPNCIARHRVAIIIPYRDRPQHLAIFLNHIHPFLMRQRLDYGIFVIEQKDSNPTPRNFNRAKLFNVGFVEANQNREGGWQCFIFHDVDLLPMDERNLYTCPRQPRHMSAAVDKFNYKLPYPELFGGVSAMTFEQFSNVNGFSNRYWGWGGEDDDMFYRFSLAKYHTARYKMSIARYTMLSHKQQKTIDAQRLRVLRKTKNSFHRDGLSNLQYELVKLVKHHLYTLVSVEID